MDIRPNHLWRRLRIEPVTTAHPNLTDRTYTTSYEPGGNVDSQLLPGGVTVTRTFDDLGQVLTEFGGTAGGDRGYAYDLAGRVTTVTSGTTTLNFDYSERNQLVTASGSAGTSTFEHDPAGRLVQRTDAAGVATFAWTTRGQLEQLTDPLTGATTTYSWNPEGTLNHTVTEHGSNLVTRAFEWDAAGHLTNDTITDSTANVSRAVTYRYDANGNLDQRTTSPGSLAGAGTDSYTYDWSNRLTSWTAPDTTVTSYTYDGNGNLTANGPTVNTYDERNRQLTTGPTTNTWTARGSLATSTTAGATTTYQTDGLGRLTAAGNVSYVYDGLDRPVTRDTASFTYSGLHNQPTTTDTATVSYGPNGELVTINDGTGALHAITDQHRDVVATIDGTGAIVDSIAFDPWGMTLSTVGATDLRWGYQSSYTDPVTDHVYMGARWYDTTGTFTNRDTWNGTNTNPITLNRYAYANTNPISNYDPTGHCAIPTLEGFKCGGVPKAHKPSPPKPQPGSKSNWFYEANGVIPPSKSMPSKSPPRTSNGKTQPQKAPTSPIYNNPAFAAANGIPPALPSPTTQAIVEATSKSYVPDSIGVTEFAQATPSCFICYVLTPLHNVAANIVARQVPGSRQDWGCRMASGRRPDVCVDSPTPGKVEFGEVKYASANGLDSGRKQVSAYVGGGGEPATPSLGWPHGGTDHIGAPAAGVTVEVVYTEPGLYSYTVIPDNGLGWIAAALAASHFVRSSSGNGGTTSTSTVVPAIAPSLASNTLVSGQFQSGNVLPVVVAGGVIMAGGGLWALRQ